MKLPEVKLPKLSELKLPTPAAVGGKVKELAKLFPDPRDVKLPKNKEEAKKFARDFWYGKPHGERRLGDLYVEKTGLYKHREWRGVKDTFYYFHMIWLYNYANMVMDIVKFGSPVTFAKGLWRYRWMGQAYLPVLHWFDRGLEGMRG